MIAFGLRRQHLGERHRARHDLGVDVRLAHAPRDQLRVLRAEVDDEDEVVLGLDRCRTHVMRSRRELLDPCRCPAHRWSDLPSVCSDGATITSAFWNSFTVS